MTSPTGTVALYLDIREPVRVYLLNSAQRAKMRKAYQFIGLWAELQLGFDCQSCTALLG
jgi:hypothetical protein